MPRAVTGCILALSLVSLGNAPSPPRQVTVQGIPVGVWLVRFENGVIESCTVRRDGTAKVVELLRASNGRVRREGRAFLITCDDDRTERWTPEGERMLVEHWCPSATWRTATPVRGEARRVR